MRREPRRRARSADTSQLIRDRSACTTIRVSRAWWLGIFPGLAIMLTVLSINFLGDALRDILDVRESRDIA